MADDDLPKEFDAVILGTGLCESVVAAALSRNGCAVLHLDKNLYYGSLEATCSFRNLLNFEKDHAPPLSRLSDHTHSGDDVKCTELKAFSTCPLSNISYDAYDISEEEQSYYENLVKTQTAVITQCQDKSVSSAEEKFLKEAGDAISSDVSADAGNSADITSVSGTEGDAHNHTDAATSSAPDNETATTADSSNESTDNSHDNANNESNVSEESTTAAGRSKESAAGEAIENTTTATSIKTDGKADTSVSNDSSSDTTKSLTTATSTAEAVEGASDPVIKSYFTTFDSETRQATLEQKLSLLIEKSNRFILDLSPKLLYSRSELIDLLITSDVAKYCEFKTITQILTPRSDYTLQVVPCSRADIFSTKSLSMIEKRILMKVLTLCMENGGENSNSQIQAYLDRPFYEFLKSQKLTDNLIHYVLHAIAMVSESANTEKGLMEMRRFLKSVGRYGHSPFLWPLYGGEINQAFCRMSAVFGGTYVLGRSLTHFYSQDNRVTSVVCSEGQTIQCKWLIINPDYSSFIAEKKEVKYMSRAILFTSCSLSTSPKEEVVLLSLPNTDKTGDPVTVLELGSSSCVSPRALPNHRVIHMTMRSTKLTAKEDLEPYIDRLFSRGNSETKPRILFACYFNIPDYGKPTHISGNHPDNLFVTVGPDSKIDSDNSVIQARQIFEKICPDQEFLPRPPDPDDIIYCDEESKTSSEQESFQTEATAEENKIPPEQESVQSVGGVEDSQWRKSTEQQTFQSAAVEGDDQ